MPRPEPNLTLLSHGFFQRRGPARAYPGVCSIKFFFWSARPAPRSYYQPTMAYRMRMFMSQKPSSVDLRVSDFKRVPGFNYVLSVSTEDEHTYNSLAQGKRENIWRSMPNLARAAAREAKIPAASSSVWPLGP